MTPSTGIVRRSTTPMGKNAKYRKLRTSIVASAIKDERWLTLSPSEQKSLIARSLRKAKRADKRGK